MILFTVCLDKGFHIQVSVISLKFEPILMKLENSLLWHKDKITEEGHNLVLLARFHISSLLEFATAGVRHETRTLAHIDTPFYCNN